MDVTDRKRNALFDYAPILSREWLLFHGRNGENRGETALVMVPIRRVMRRGMQVVSKRKHAVNLISRHQKPLKGTIPGHSICIRFNVFGRFHHWHWEWGIKGE